MKTLAKLLSAVALVGTIAPSMLLLAGVLAPGPMKWWMLLATLVWFAATPVWIDRGGGR